MSELAQNLRPVKQVVAACPVFTVGSLGKIIERREVNGFAPCVGRIGRRCFIDLTELDKWLEAKRC